MKIGGGAQRKVDVTVDLFAVAREERIRDADGAAWEPYRIRVTFWDLGSVAVEVDARKIKKNGDPGQTFKTFTPSAIKNTMAREAVDAIVDELRTQRLDYPFKPSSPDPVSTVLALEARRDHLKARELQTRHDLAYAWTKLQSPEVLAEYRRRKDS